MIIQIISVKNGVGLTRDMNILHDILRPYASHIILSDVFKSQPVKADINIFCEVVNRKFFRQGTFNYLIPNPEWFESSWIGILPQFHKILCKTKDAVRIFGQWHKNCHYTSFTSEDRHVESDKYKSFVHLPGKSSSKGTGEVIKAWQSDDSLLPLSIIQHEHNRNPRHHNIRYIFGKMNDETFRKLQNESAFHVCTSSYEGFGHYIFEALSCGSIVITTDHAPMNELIDNDIGVLCKTKSFNSQRQAKMGHVEPLEIIRAAKECMEMDNQELHSRFIKSRALWVSNDNFFKREIINALGL